MERVEAKGKEIYPDFIEVLETAKAAGVSFEHPGILRLIFGHSSIVIGAKAAYELAKDPLLTRQLFAIRDQDQFWLTAAPFITRLTAAPVSGPAEKTTPVSKALEPPKPVGAAPTASLPSLEQAVAGTEISLARFRQIRDARGGR